MVSLLLLDCPWTSSICAADAHVGDNDGMCHAVSSRCRFATAGNRISQDDNLSQCEVEAELLGVEMWRLLLIHIRWDCSMYNVVVWRKMCKSKFIWVSLLEMEQGEYFRGVGTTRGNFDSTKCFWFMSPVTLLPVSDGRDLFQNRVSQKHYSRANSGRRYRKLNFRISNNRSLQN